MLGHWRQRVGIGVSLGHHRLRNSGAVFGEGTAVLVALLGLCRDRADEVSMQ